jgi:ABC-type multidrug transport system fused ATPase/permease subunit
MILILSFKEKEMSIKRYLKYYLVKNSIRTWKFLSKRSKEIEFNENHKEEKENGDGLPKEDCEDTQITNNTISVVLDFKCIKSIFALITFVVLSIYSNVLRLFISSCFIFSYFAIISSPIPLIFNILYSVYAYSILISSRSSSFYVYFIIFMHSLFFFIIYFMQNSCMKINKIREAKEIITHLVLENNYDLQKFCHTCLNLKLEGNRHCSICKRCIIGYNHHCPFFNKCISKKTFIVFNLFIFFSMILFTLAVYKANLRLSKFEFLICLFVSFGSFVMFLVNFKKA